MMEVDQDSHPVKVSEETWRDLNARKHPGDSFEDVIRRLLDEN
ncbi:antitoxin VapB family protein [Halobacterium salinarum]|nr:antitoxin VapB family protein [Halobacterium salinarum]